MYLVGLVSKTSDWHLVPQRNPTNYKSYLDDHSLHSWVHNQTSSSYVWGANSLLRAVYYDYYIPNFTYIAKIDCPA